MPTKTPWPDPFSGFTEGFTGGMKMGLLRRQQNLAEQESLAKAAAEKEKAEAEVDKEKLEYFTKIQADPNTSDDDSIAAHNALIPIIKKRYGVEWTPTDTWTPEYTKAAKQALNIWNNPDYAPADKLKLIQGVYTATTEAAQKRLKPMLDEAKQGAEQSALQGASDISTRMRMNPDLVAQTDPSVLEGIESEKNRLMVEGGATPEQMLFKGEKDQFYSMPTEEISQRLFNTPYAKLTPDQRGVVFKEEERIKKETEQRTKTGGKGKDELDVRKGIETILGKEMTSKFGGVKYDMINEQFVFPEKGIDQTAFWTEYTRRKRAYLKKYGLEEVLPEVSNESKEWKKYLPQGQ